MSEEEAPQHIFRFDEDQYTIEDDGAILVGAEAISILSLTSAIRNLTSIVAHGASLLFSAENRQAEAQEKIERHLASLVAMKQQGIEGITEAILEELDNINDTLDDHADHLEDLQLEREEAVFLSEFDDYLEEEGEEVLIDDDDDLGADEEAAVLEAGITTAHPGRSVGSHRYDGLHPDELRRRLAEDGLTYEQYVENFYKDCGDACRDPEPKQSCGCAG